MGEISSVTNNNPQYNELAEEFARRTYDESGDYVVDNFSLDVREYYQQDGNLGVYSLDDIGTVNGLSPNDAKNKLVASVGPGKAYVKGFEIVNTETKYLPIDKARETLGRDDIRLKTTGLPTYKITNTWGSVPLNSEGADLIAYPNVFLTSTFSDGSIGLNGNELDTDNKQTISRRGQLFDINTGVKTIYVNIDPSTDLNNLDITSSTPVVTDNFNKRLNYISLTGLWITKSRSTATASAIAVSYTHLTLPTIYSV